MQQQRDRYRRDTEAGKKAAAREAQRRTEAAAAIRLQSLWRRVLAKQKVSGAYLACLHPGTATNPPFRLFSD